MGPVLAMSGRCPEDEPRLAEGQAELLIQRLGFRCICLPTNMGPCYADSTPATRSSSSLMSGH